MSDAYATTIERANAALMVRGDLDAIPEFFTEDYRAHLTDGDVTGGHDAVRRVLQMYRSAFSDLEVQVETLVESGDRAAWQRTLRATHSGPFRGFPATGKPITWREMLVSRLADGRIAEEWVVSDLAEKLLLTRAS